MAIEQDRQAAVEARLQKLEVVAALAAKYVTHLGKPLGDSGNFMEGIKLQLALEKALMGLDNPFGNS